MGMTWNRCDECGRFIPMTHFESGEATHHMTEPDSAFGPEDWETLCSRHNRYPTYTAQSFPPSPVKTAQQMFADTHAASGKTKKGEGGVKP